MQNHAFPKNVPPARYVWAGHGLVLVLGLAAIIAGVEPRVHHLTMCPSTPKNTAYVLDKTRGVLRDSLQVPVTFEWLRDWSNESMMQKRGISWLYNVTTQVSVRYEPQTLSHLQMVWVENFHGVFVANVPDSLIQTDGVLNGAKVRVVYPDGIPGAVVHLRESGGADRNLACARGIVRTVLWRPTTGDSLRAAALSREIERRSYEHIMHLSREWPFWVRLIGGVVLMFMTLWSYGHLVYWTIQATHARYRVFRSRGYRVSPPSLFRCFVISVPGAYPGQYESVLQRQTQAYLKELRAEARRCEEVEREERRVEERQVVLIASLEALWDLVDHLPDAPGDLIEAFQNAPKPTYTESLAALQEIRRRYMEVLESRKPKEEVHPTITVRQMVTGSYRSKKRPVAQPVLLPSAGPMVRERGKNGSGIVDYAALVESLNIHDLVPVDIDHDHVAAILIAGLLKPGQRGAAYWGGRYREERHIRKNTQSKLGRCYNPDRYHAAMHWLVRNKVVLYPKARPGVVLQSLNPDKDAATSIGRQMLERILYFQDEIVPALRD